MPMKNGRPFKRIPWTSKDERKLVGLVRKHQPVTKIARELNRSPSAIYQRASYIGVSLGRQASR